MARVRLKFVDVTVNTLSIEVSATTNKPYIGVLIQDDNKEEHSKCIFLDLSTAIKLSKALRNEINKAKEVENV